jgi:hypothetical protein
VRRRARPCAVSPTSRLRPSAGLARRSTKSIFASRSTDLETPLGLRLRCSPSSPIGSVAPGAGRRDECDQYPVGVDAKAVTGKQCPVQCSKDGGVDPQHAAPGAELAGCQRARLGRAIEVERTPGFDPRTT